MIEDADAGYAYWTRYADLGKAARGRTAEQQAAHLARWVMDGFDEFRRSARRVGDRP
ncbi:MAG TPA: hypothetical protein VN213_08785 [Solirubrobacteraceae bacterium]|nr:hypothetical protein [Solirubrobacteraceae bacterium]